MTKRNRTNAALDSVRWKRGKPAPAPLFDGPAIPAIRESEDERVDGGEVAPLSPAASRFAAAIDRIRKRGSPGWLGSFQSST